MSDTNKPDRIFADGVWIKEKRFDNGGSILRVSIQVDKFAPFVKKNKNKSGYINIIVAPRKNADEKSTHMAYLDTWEPSKTQAAPAPAPQPRAKVAPQEDDAPGF